MKRALSLPILAAIVLVGGMLSLAAPAANGDEASQPFATTKLLPKKCQKADTFREVRTVKRAPRESDTPKWYYVGTTQSATGHLKTYVYVKNSFRHYVVSIMCASDKDKYRFTNPVTYFHKTQYVNFNCYGGSCRHLYTTTSKWEEGYCSRGSDGKVCTFD